MSIAENLKRLMQFLRASKEDRGVMADLRRGFSPGTEQRCWPHIATFCDLADDTQRIICQTVAAGFATHKKTEARGNLGVSLRRLALDGHSGKPDDALKSFDARFRRLLTCDTAAEVCKRLIPIVRATERKNIPLDFEKLYEDLHMWEVPGSDVKVRWAATYWSGGGGQAK